jgi:hypothetical protein
MGTLSGDRALLVGDSGSGAQLLEPETPDKIVAGEVWVTSGDDGKLPLGVRVGTARKDGATWRIDLAMESAPVDFVRLVPPPDFARLKQRPNWAALRATRTSRLRTVSARRIAAATTPAVPPAAGAATPRPPAAAPRPAATPPAQPPAQQPAQSGGQGGGQ